MQVLRIYKFGHVWLTNKKNIMKMNKKKKKELGSVNLRAGQAE